MPRILIVTGEASGDLHGANLAIALRKLKPDVRLFGAGGFHMKAAGVELIPGMERLDAVGVLGLKQIRKGLSNLFRLRRFLRREKLDAVVLIDNPGTNLRLARIAARIGHRVIYYIAPQIWAWGARRMKLIRRVVHRMIVILPFEESLFRNAGVACDFVGHPLLDTLAPAYDKNSLRHQLGLPQDELVIGLLPGSRVPEVRTLLPPMIQAVKHIARFYPGIQCVIGRASSISEDLIESVLDRTGLQVTVTGNHTNEVMATSDLLLVASGTATLQAALIGTPMVITYRLSWLTYQVAKRLVTVKYIGLVNLVAGRGIVPELIQDEATAEKLSEEALMLLRDQGLCERMREAFRAIRGELGTPGASTRAAHIVLAECQG